MDENVIMAISASAMRAQRLRMDVIAANLANAETTRGADGGPYRRRAVVFKAEPVAATFEGELQARLAGRDGLLGVRVSAVVEDRGEPRLVYDPGHPDANADGYVAMPNVNVLSEMVDLMNASRAFEANVTAVNAAKRLMEAALEISGR